MFESDINSFTIYLYRKPIKTYAEGNVELKFN